MPEKTAKLLDIRTSSVTERIAAVDDFLAAGYEVHLNLSPVVVHEEWLEDWAELLDHLNDVLSPAAKAQAAAEVIFLTHNQGLHEVNLLAPAGREPVVASRHPGVQGLAERDAQRALPRGLEGGLEAAPARPDR